MDEYIIENSLIIQVGEQDLRSDQHKHIVIDLRPAEDFEKGHFSYSYNISTDLKLSTEEIWAIVAGRYIIYMCLTYHF
jgi:hypothetical protein